MDDPILAALLHIASLEGPNLPPYNHAALLRDACNTARIAVGQYKARQRSDEAECWKAEADALRRIVMEALAEFEAMDDGLGMTLPDHWSKRARELFGID